jgi:predicted TIM-barrel fold metal-dependent hydrolase
VSDCLDVAAAFPKVRFNLAHSLRFDREYLKRASEMKNVWVDCSAHLVHCQLARQNAPPIAPPARRIAADFSDPVKVLRMLHEILSGRCLWGSDNPYMSWCADSMRVIFSYADEAAVLNALPADVKKSISCTAPEAWLLG